MKILFRKPFCETKSHIQVLLRERGNYERFEVILFNENELDHEVKYTGCDLGMAQIFWCQLGTNRVDPIAIGRYRERK